MVECFRLIFTTETELRVFTTDILSLLFLLLLHDNSCLFLHSFVLLRSLITETCPRTSIVGRLRSQNGLGQKWLLFCQESHTWFSFSGDPLPYPICLQYQSQVHVFLTGYKSEVPMTDAENSASVQWCLIKSRRQSFGWRGKKYLYFFARQRGTQWAHASQNCGSQSRRMWWGVLWQWFKGGVAYKDQGVGGACTPLIWSQVVSWWAFLVPLICPQVISWWASLILEAIKLWPFLWNEEC